MRKKDKLVSKKTKKKGEYTLEDIDIGDAICWYKNGFRCDEVIGKRKGRKLKTMTIFTPRYGKIKLEDVFQVSVRKNGKTFLKEFSDPFETVFD